MTSLALISNIFSGDGLIIFLILLLLFGAKKLPELAKGLGSAVREFSKAKDEIEHEITRPNAPQIQSPPHTYAHDEPHVAPAATESPFRIQTSLRQTAWRMRE
jgi:sec-independent protein translocase protein TatA